MGRIYREAALVHVWLGLEDEKTKLAAQVVKKIVSLHATKANGMESNYDPDLTFFWHLRRQRHIPDSVSVRLMDDAIQDIRKENHQYLITLSEWESFTSLIHRQWFTRVWILQETSQAKHVQMSCGAQNIVWEDIYRALMILTPSRDAFATGPQVWKRISEGSTAFVCAELHSRLQPGEDYALAHMNQIVTWSQTSRLPLEALLMLTWAFKATDPRDKIYALLGLAKGWDQTHGIQPDYQRTTVDLYTEATQLLLGGFGPIDDVSKDICEVSRGDIPELSPLEILTFANHGRYLSRNGFPSWVLDLGHTRHGPRLWYNGYNPAGSLTAKWSFPRTGILRTHGLILDTVQEVEQTFSDLTPDSFNRFIYWFAIIPPVLDDDFLDMLCSSLTVSRSDDRFKFSRGTTRDDFTSFLRLCAQRRLLHESGLETRSEQHNLLNWRGNWDRVVAASGPSRPLPTIVELEIELYDASVRLLRLHMSAADLYRETRGFLSPMRHFLENRVLFRVEADNKMGIAPIETQTGDYVIAIGGAATLFVVRRVSEEPEEWRLLGETFMPWCSDKRDEVREFEFQ
jgi:hypothetical protein